VGKEFVQRIHPPGYLPKAEHNDSKLTLHPRMGPKLAFLLPRGFGSGIGRLPRLTQDFACRRAASLFKVSKCDPHWRPVPYARKKLRVQKLQQYTRCPESVNASVDVRLWGIWGLD